LVATGGALGALWTFMKAYKTLLLLLIIIWLELLGALLVLSRGSPLAPFIYANF